MDPRPPKLLQPGTQWRALRGCAWGIGQPTLTGYLTVLHTAWTPEPFDAYMQELLDEAPPDGPLAAGTHGIASRFMHWWGAIQRAQRVPVFGHGRVISTRTEGGRTRFEMALPCYNATCASKTLEWLTVAMEGFFLGRPDARAKASSTFTPLLDTLRTHGLQGTNSYWLVKAAHAQGVPYRLVLPRTYSLGFGAKGRRFQSTLTGHTSSLAMQVAHSKRWTAHLLRQHGIEVPQHEIVGDAEAAVVVARRLGYPVVVKPDDQEQGRGVSPGLPDDAAVRDAYALARGFSAHVLVEKHHAGEDYRINVMHGEVIKILHRRPAAVEGDGVNTVAQLVELDLQGRLRKSVRQNGRRMLDLDAEALSLLSQQGLAPNDVPGPGRRVLLRRKSNISAGGIQSLVLPADVHPDNLALAIDATRAVGLDLCGVDLLLPDIARSWRETGGVVIEVNGMPQIGQSVGPQAYDRIIELMMDGDGRVPVHLVLRAGGDTSVDGLRSLADTLGCNAVAAAEGVWIDGRQRGLQFASAQDAACVVLLDTAVRGAVIALSPADVLAHGLPMDRACRVHVLGHPADAQAQATLQRALAMIGGPGESA